MKIWSIFGIWSSVMDFSRKAHDKNGFLFKMGGSNDGMSENSFLLTKSKIVGGMDFRGNLV